MPQVMSRRSAHLSFGPKGFIQRGETRLGFRERELLDMLVQGGIHLRPNGGGYRMYRENGQACSAPVQRVQALIRKGLLRVRGNQVLITAKGAYYHAIHS